MLHIVKDGSADMPDNWQDQFQIDVLPLMVRFGEETYVAGVDLTHSEFYQLVREKGVIPHSSLPSPDQIQAFYRKTAVPGDDILSIHVSSKMSGTFSAVKIAATEMLNEMNITVLDSGAGSAALGFMCREARQLSQAGHTVNQIVRRLEEVRQQLTVFFTVENLEFARMSGRISRFQNSLSFVFNIKPIIMLKDGLLQVGEKVRTRQKALERIIECVRGRIGQQQVEIAVVHAADITTAQKLVDCLRDWKNVIDIHITDLAIPVAANLGPGTVGIVAYPIDKGE